MSRTIATLWPVPEPVEPVEPVGVSVVANRRIRVSSLG